MAIDVSTAEVIGNFIGGLMFYGLLCGAIYYLVRLGIRHERKKHKEEVEKELKEMKLNVRDKR